MHTRTATPSAYLLDNAAPQTPIRFTGIELAYDRRTFDIFERLSVAPGWHCLEIGAGGGSVARWLTERVGPTGRVTATDLDTRWLDEQIWPATVTVVRHDITVDPLPERAFDLIHTRLVLVHVKDMQPIAERLVRALKPGGWLVLEEFDCLIVSGCPDPLLPHADLLNKVRSGFNELLKDRGQELLAGRNLHRLLRGLGLQEVDAEGYVAYYRGGSPIAGLEQANFHQIGDQLVGRAGLTRQELDSCIEVLHDESVVANLPMLISAYGRKPNE